MFSTISRAPASLCGGHGTGRQMSEEKERKVFVHEEEKGDWRDSEDNGDGEKKKTQGESRQEDENK